MGWIPFGSETNNRDRLRFVQLNWSTKEIPTNHRVFRSEGWGKREKPSWYSLKKNVSFFLGRGYYLTTFEMSEIRKSGNGQQPCTSIVMIWWMKNKSVRQRGFESFFQERVGGGRGTDVHRQDYHRSKERWEMEKSFQDFRSHHRYGWGSWIARVALRMDKDQMMMKVRVSSVVDEQFQVCWWWTNHVRSLAQQDRERYEGSSPFHCTQDFDELLPVWETVVVEC